ncbi:hypothetical protein B0A55_07532, partial [Friedmanniomyces simplex]
GGAEDNASQEVDLEAQGKEVGGAEPLDAMQSALKIALLDHALAIRRCLGLYNRSAFWATKAELVPRFEASFGYELGVLFPLSAGLMSEPSPRATIDGLQVEDGVRDTAETAAQATGGAQAESANASEEQPREGRRRSLPWLSRRGSSSLSKQANGSSDTNGNGNGGRSHSRQRSRSRLRDPSLTRRLSFFRSSEDKARDKLANNEAGEDRQQSAPKQQGGDHYRPAMVSQQASNYSAMSTAQLKKRLSFLRNSGVPIEVTATGEATGSYT